ncbi:DUF397 domain-containing protein [Streptomyces sp. wa22]|uniref:DUF397 domain-containing protein n=1 Tax=Streptomyces sp. wa22 TaxID=1828244 RepID=UPI0011C94399|nr:DUF397 domain-containing protein [Streptomyces sp. wa22]TXS10036.1 DUF397 domain-containing protein [Streptomyces sp. wa22]
MTDEPRWHRSSYSSNGGNCVEVAPDLARPHGVVPVRDSKNPGGAVLNLPVASFASFVDGVRAGAFGKA